MYIIGTGRVNPTWDPLFSPLLSVGSGPKRIVLTDWSHTDVRGVACKGPAGPAHTGAQQGPVSTTDSFLILWTQMPNNDQMQLCLAASGRWIPALNQGPVPSGPVTCLHRTTPFPRCMTETGKLARPFISPRRPPGRARRVGGGKPTQCLRLWHSLGSSRNTQYPVCQSWQHVNWE